jgi:hypothetical protein
LRGVKRRRDQRKSHAGFGLADPSPGPFVEDDDDLVGVLFRLVKSQAAEREITRS